MHFERCKKYGTRLAASLLALTAAVWSAPAVSAAEASDPLTDFEITLDGEKIAETDYYGGPVSVNIKLKGSSDTYTLWINDGGVWKLISPKDGNYQSYTLSFPKDGEYDFTFRVENKTTMNKSTDDVRFTVSSALQSALADIDALPDPDDAADQTITANKDKIISTANTVNGLRGDLRSEISEASLEKLGNLQKKLTALDSSGDFVSPAAIKANIVGDFSKIGSAQYYKGSASLTVSTGGNAAFINDGSGWKPLEGSGLEFTEPGRYQIDVCTENASQMRSPAVSFDFYVDPDIPDIVEEVDRLYSNAQSIDQEEYVTGLEHLYKQYLEMTPQRQYMMPTRTTDRMIYMHDYILQQLKFNNSEKIDDRYIMAIGMYAALDIPKLNLGSDEVSLVASRSDAVTELPDSVKGKALAEYHLSFSCPGMEEDNLPIDAGEPIRICLQIPEDLKGKKNVDILFVEDGAQPVSMGAKVRSSEDNLVAYFTITKAGKYVFVADE